MELLPIYLPEREVLQNAGFTESGEQMLCGIRTEMRNSNHGVSMFMAVSTATPA